MEGRERSFGPVARTEGYWAGDGEVSRPALISAAARVAASLFARCAAAGRKDVTVLAFFTKVKGSLRSRNRIGRRDGLHETQRFPPTKTLHGLHL
jgi:hypothetical protein